MLRFSDPRVVRPSAQELRQSLRVTAKEAIWLATARHRQGPLPNILLFGMARGGGTWVMQLIDQEPGVRSLNEPLAPWEGHPAPARRFPKYEGGHAVAFETEGEEARFRAYVDALLSGQLATGAPWWFWRRDYPFVSNRLVLKIYEAKALVDWFDTNFDVDIVYTTRHPISQSLACIRNGWAPLTRVYLNNPWFGEQVGEDRVAYGRRIVESGSRLEQQVLGWVLENYVALQRFPDRPQWLFVGYENCVVEPEATLDRLAARLHLTATDRMRAMLRRPSRSSHMSAAGTRQSIEQGDAASTIARWRAEIDPATEQSLLDILRVFDIPLYVPGEDLPQPWWAVG